jgi:hypothetical protein
MRFPRRLDSLSVYHFSNSEKVAGVYEDSSAFDRGFE